MSRKLKARYNRQYAEAKAEFLQRTGKQIGRGFAKSPEYRAVRKRETQALWRERVRIEMQTATPAAKSQTDTETVIEEGGLFWLSLYGNQQSTESVPMGAYKEAQIQAKQNGWRLIGTVIYPDGIGVNCENESKFRHEIAKLAKHLRKEQKATGKYPVVNTTLIEKPGNKQVFILVESELV